MATKKRYVIFREDNNTHKELYVQCDSQMCDNTIHATEDADDALAFSGARGAYEWAGARKLDWWRVGVR